MAVPPYKWKLYDKNVNDRTMCKKEMLCDLLGSCLGSQWRQNNKITLENAAYVCRDSKEWSVDLYKLSYQKPNKMLPRWKKKEFDDEKHVFIIWIKCLLHKKISFNVFMTGLYSFKCVEAYIIDLQWQQYAKQWVYFNIFKEEYKIDTEWSAFKIAFDILKIIFGIEKIVMDKDFKNAKLDGFIHSISCQGLNAMSKNII